MALIDRVFFIRGKITRNSRVSLQAVSVFQTIHSMDHFYLDLARCPICGRQREQGKVRIQASPCRYV